MSKFTQSIYKVTKTVSKHAPLMLTGVGIIGLGATAYFSFKSSKRVEEILNEKEEYNDAVELYNEEVAKKTAAFENERNGGDRLTEEEIEDLDYNIAASEEVLNSITPMERKEFIKRMGAAVALPVITGIASISCISASYYMLNNRLLNTAAALATSVAENEYRRRRTEQAYGQEGVDKVYGAPTVKENVTTTNAKGKEVTEDVDVAETMASLHGAWFKNSSEYASDNHDYNLQYIDSVEEALQNRLFARGFLTLNEVYSRLGLPKSRGGAVVGWTAGDSFSLLTECPIVFDKDLGMKVPQIYVKWSSPKDIFNSIELEGRYSVSGL